MDLVLGFVGDDVHHTAHGIGAVDGRERAFEDLDLFDVARIECRDIVRSRRDAVYQYGYILTGGLETADTDVRTKARVLYDIERTLRLEDVGHVVKAGLLDVARWDEFHLGRYLFQRYGRACRIDRDGLKIVYS